MNIIIIILILIIFAFKFKYISPYSYLDYVNKIYSNMDKNIQYEYYPTTMKWCKELRNNHKIILDEYINYISKHKLKRFKDIDPYQTNLDNYNSNIPWEVLFLKVYNKQTSKIKYFPKTYSLISKIPGCTLAMFSVLHPNKTLPPHVGPYKGVLRYHLALVTPKNEKQCKLFVNNIEYNWKKGEDVLFDDTFLHHVKNESNETRVVLFLDIKKEFNNIFLDSLNSFILSMAKFTDKVIDISNNT